MKLLINYLQIKLFRLKPLARKRVALALLASMLIFNQSNAINFSFGGLFSSLFSKKSTSGLIGANLVSANSAVANAAKKPFLNTKTLGLAILSVGCIAVVGYVLNFAIKRYKEEKLIDELKEIMANQDDSREESLKKFKATLVSLEKVAHKSIGKIINDNSLLHVASSYDQTEEMKLLIENGANVDANEYNEYLGETALHIATKYNKTNAAKFLLENNANIFAINKKRKKPFDSYIDKLNNILNLQELSENNLKEFKDTLAELEKIAGQYIGKIIDKFGLLHDAALNSQKEAIIVLVKLGADIEAKTTSGCTALHYAALSGKTESIKVLVELGADINAYADGWTALHYAAWNNQTESIKILVEKGADINAKITADGAHKGKTAFNFAKDQPKTLELLNWAKDYDASEDKKVFMRNLMVDGVEKFIPEILEIGQESLLSEQQHKFNLVVLRALNTAMQKQDYDLINFILNNKLIEGKATFSSLFRQALCVALKETGKKSAFEIFYQSSDKNTLNKSTLTDLFETDTENFDLNEKNDYLKFLKKAAEINKLRIPKGFVGGERTKRCLMDSLNKKSLLDVRINFAN